MADMTSEQTRWTREMATDLAREQWREGWLDGRAMSLRLLRLELTVMEPVSREAALELVDAMLAGVEQDKASPGAPTPRLETQE